MPTRTTRLKVVKLSYLMDYMTGKPSEGEMERYILQNETGGYIYPEGWQSQFEPLSGAGEDVKRRFCEATYATPEEAWQSIANRGFNVLPEDTPLYRYTFVMKENQQRFVFISRSNSLPDTEWSVIETLDSGTVMIAMPDVSRFQVEEI